MIDVAGGNILYYYHFDGLGSVIALSKVNGEIVERYSYDVFGEPNRISDVNNPYMFTGREYDEETGNYYYRARYYNPHIGRFLQADPIGIAGGINIYTYCLNNPTNWVDPWGLAPEEWHDSMSSNPSLGKYGHYDHQQPYNLMDHFRDIGDVENDMSNDRNTGNRSSYDDRMHEGQDSITQGSGPLAVVGHIVGSALGVIVPQMNPDFPYTDSSKKELKPSYDKAEKWTHEQEKAWDKEKPGDKDGKGAKKKKGSQS